MTADPFGYRDPISRWVTSTARDMRRKMRADAVVLVAASSVEPGLLFAAELGMAVLLDKPLVLTSPRNMPLPPSRKLDAVVDEWIRVDHDTEPGLQRSLEELDAALTRLGVPE